MSPPALEIAVIGAGAAGLAAALDLRRLGVECLVLEARDEPGGVMQTVSREGFVYERGPNAFRIGAPARAWLRRHALLHALRPAGPEALRRSLFLDGRLVPVPTSLGEARRSPILSRAGKRRALREAFVARGDGGSESVAAFIERRFGPELLTRAVAPFLVGVYAGDERELGAEAVFPSLVKLERERGSVLRGALRGAFSRRGERARGAFSRRGEQARGAFSRRGDQAGGAFSRRGERPLAGSWSGAGGLGGFARRAAERLRETLRLATPVAAVAREPGGGWRIETESGDVLGARRLLFATEPQAAAKLLAPVDTELARGLAEIETAPLVTAALDVDPGATRVPLEGFGFLVPREAQLDLLGALFMSRVFPGRAPPGRELVVAMLGGRRWPGAVAADDDTLMARIEEGLERTLGLTGARLLGLHRWPRAVPQPGPDHPRRVQALRARAAALGGLALAGNYLDGVGVSDAIASGAAAAAELAPTAR